MESFGFAQNLLDLYVFENVYIAFLLFEDSLIEVTAKTCVRFLLILRVLEDWINK